MGGAQSRVNPSVEGKYLAVPDLHQFCTRAMTVDSGPLPCFIVRKSGQIRFYLRCLKDGSVTQKLIMYCKQKSNGNFRIYKKGDSRHPIGYIKKGDRVYRVYCGRTYCAKIGIQHRRYEKVTSMIIIGHRDVEFVSRVRYQNITEKFRVDCEQPCSLLQAFAFAVLCQ